MKRKEAQLNRTITRAKEAQTQANRYADKYAKSYDEGKTGYFGHREYQTASTRYQNKANRLNKKASRLSYGGMCK